MITIDDFSKIEIRVGKVSEAGNVEGSEKLIRLVVDFGTSAEALANGDSEPEKRIIFAGVRGFGYQPEDFINKQFLFVTNLEPRKMPSYVETSERRLPEYSQGMILAVDSAGSPQVDDETSDPLTSSGQAKPLFISAEGLPVGSKVR